MTGLVLLLAASVDAISRKRSTPSRSKEVGTAQQRGVQRPRTTCGDTPARMLRYLHEAGEQSLRAGGLHRAESQHGGVVSGSPRRDSSARVPDRRTGRTAVADGSAGSRLGGRRRLRHRVERTVVAVVGLGGRVLRKEQRHRRATSPLSRRCNIVTLTAQALTRPRQAAWASGSACRASSTMPIAASGWHRTSAGRRAAGRPRPAGPTAGSLPSRRCRWATTPISAPSRSSRAGSERTAATSCTCPVRSASAAASSSTAGSCRGPAATAARWATWSSTRRGPCRCGATGCWETEIIATRWCARRASASRSRSPLSPPRHRGTGRRRRRSTRSGSGWAWGSPTWSTSWRSGGHLRLLLPLVSSAVPSAPFALPRHASRWVEVPSLSGDSTLLGAAESAFGALLADPIGELARSQHAAAS